MQVLFQCNDLQMPHWCRGLIRKTTKIKYGVWHWKVMGHNFTLFIQKCQICLGPPASLSAVLVTLRVQKKRKITKTLLKSQCPEKFLPAFNPINQPCYNFNLSWLDIKFLNISWLLTTLSSNYTIMFVFKFVICCSLLGMERCVRSCKTLHR